MSVEMLITFMSSNHRRDQHKGVTL